MNKRRLGELARWLERGAPEKRGVAQFDMNYFGSHTDVATCGTRACLAGTTNAWWGGPHVSLGNTESARKLLELPTTLSGPLFWPNIYDAYHAPPAWAARVVRKLIATGEVDWEGTE